MLGALVKTGKAYACGYNRKASMGIYLHLGIDAFYE
jgi:hypothetical protein